MRLPGPENRTFIVGKTGSGKTRFATWLHAKTSQFKARPYVIIDTKREKLFSQIERAEEIRINEVPKHPGLYIMRPFQMDPALEPWFMKVLDRENIGLYIDEGFMVPGIFPRYRGLNGILTQGRSKKIPAIILSQRPANVTTYAVSEADFIAAFKLQRPEDMDKVEAYLPNEPLFDLRRRLPNYHCRWYDVARDEGAILSPCPLDDEILNIYDLALRKTVRNF
jgi:hypothetical protein